MLRQQYEECEYRHTLNSGNLYRSSFESIYTELNFKDISLKGLFTAKGCT